MFMLFDFSETRMKENWKVTENILFPKREEIEFLTADFALLYWFPAMFALMSWNISAKLELFQ